MTDKQPGTRVAPTLRGKQLKIAADKLGEDIEGSSDTFDLFFLIIEEPTEDTTTFELMRSYLHGHRGQKLVGGKPLMNRGRLTLADRTLKLRKSFERALVVDCTNKKSIAIKLDLNHPSLTETERTLMQSAFISSPKATCHSGEFNGFGDFLRFSLPSTKDCGIDYWETNETFTFSNTVDNVGYNRYK